MGPVSLVRQREPRSVRWTGTERRRYSNSARCAVALGSSLRLRFLSRCSASSLSDDTPPRGSHARNLLSTDSTCNTARFVSSYRPRSGRSALASRNIRCVPRRGEFSRQAVAAESRALRCCRFCSGQSTSDPQGSINPGSQLSEFTFQSSYEPQIPTYFNRSIDLLWEQRVGGSNPSAPTIQRAAYNQGPTQSQSDGIRLPSLKSPTPTVAENTNLLLAYRPAKLLDGDHSKQD
jgi:hypothetical protein